MTTAEKIQMMRDAGLARRAEKVWRNANGTWSHHRDAQRQWDDMTGCTTDLRFCDEWAA